jgi:type II secretory pathway pseudopilin PulG
MKSPGRIFKSRGESGMSHAELVVVIVLAVIVIALIPLVFSYLLEKGRQAQALNNAKGIALVMRLYASDNNGDYPSTTLRNGKPTATPVSDSNTVFAQLFPNYVTAESIFWVRRSAFCSTAPPDEIMDNPPLDTPVNSLKSGENEWAYVLGLTDKSNPSLPLIADGFANAATHVYSNDPHQKGGVWKGKVIVVCADSSGTLQNIDQADMTVHGPNGNGSVTGDIFTTANAASGWLTPANVVVNPK